MILDVATMESPIGRITLAVREGRLCAVEFTGQRERIAEELARRFGAFTSRPGADPAGTVTALGAYFDGDVGALDRLEVDAEGTPFQRRVWDALRGIPAGAPISYAALAARIGAPRAHRAVGTANGRNPIPLVVPCHRVVATGGGLGGYGGGLDRKRWLLAHEARAAGVVLV